MMKYTTTRSTTSSYVFLDATCLGVSPHPTTHIHPICTIEPVHRTTCENQDLASTKESIRNIKLDQFKNSNSVRDSGIAGTLFETDITCFHDSPHSLVRGKDNFVFASFSLTSAKLARVFGRSF